MTPRFAKAGRLPLVVAAVLISTLVPPASAGAAELGVNDFFGNPTAAPGTAGDRFGANPLGVAVNDTSGDVYVVDSDNSRIVQYTAAGQFVRAFGNDVAGDGKERQSLSVAASSGTFTLSFNGQTTGPIAFNAPSLTVQSALEGLSTVGAGNVRVTGGFGNVGGIQPYFLTFIGALAGQDLPTATADPAGLGGQKITTVTALADGFAGVNPDNATELQAVRVNAAGGQFRLVFGSGGPGISQTADIPFNASAAQVESALNAIANVNQGGGSVSVSGGPGDNGGTTPYLVSFDGGPLAGTDVAEMSGVQGTTPLSGGSDTGANQALVNTFSRGGASAANERQAVRVNATAGQFRLSFGTTGSGGGPGITQTADIAFNASAAEVASALNALTNVNQGGGSVSVSGGPGDNGGTTPYLVSFDGGPLAGTDVNQLGSAQGTVPLSGGLGPAANLAVVNTWAPGVGGFEICEEALKCKAGTSAATGGGLSSPRGIAINQTTGDLYVSNQGHQRIEQFDSKGNFIRTWGPSVIATGGPSHVPFNEIQNVTIGGGPTGGSFALTFGGTSTAAIPFNASPSAVQVALENIAAIGAGNVLVTSSNPGGGAAAGGPYTVEFRGTLADRNVSDIATNAGGLTPAGGKTVTGITIQQGAISLEVCTAAAICRAGESAGGGSAGSFGSTLGYPAVAPAGSPNEGNVLVGSISTRVQEFTARGAFVRAFGGDVVATGPGDTGTGFEVCVPANLDKCKAGSVGSGLGQFGAQFSPTRIAEDVLGNIYTIEGVLEGFCGGGGAMSNRMQKFAPQAGPVPLAPSVFAAGALSITKNCTVTDLAFDRQAEHLYVVRAFAAGEGSPPAASAEKRILELDSPGNLLQTHVAGYGIGSVNGLAVEEGGTGGYLTSSTPKPGVSVLGPPLPPEASVEPTTEVGTQSATFHGTVNPKGGGSQHTTYRFEYSADGGSSWTKATSTDTDVGSGEAPVPVNQAVSGLQPNKDYLVRIVAIKGGLPTNSVPGGAFKTDPVPPSVKTFAAFWDTSTEELVLRGSVNPNNSPTTYYFEYGTEACGSSACESVPPAQNGPVGSGGAPVTKAQRVQGLAPGETYHFRIVADNGVGTGPGATEVRGDELTLAIPDVETCSNEAFRTGPSAQLPECRAYEWVSAGDSWGLGLSSGVPLAVGDDGESAQFSAQAFGDPRSLPLFFNPYTSLRTPAGWAVKGLLPGSEMRGKPFTAADLKTTLWLGGAGEEMARGEIDWDVVRLDGGISGPSQPFVPLNSFGAGDDASYGEIPLDGAAADLSTVTFHFFRLRNSWNYFSDEPLITSNTRSNLYAISGADGQSPVLSVVNRADGRFGAVLGGACGAGSGGNISGNARDRNTISRDGSVIYFSARPNTPAVGMCTGGNEIGIGGPKRIYKRIDLERTVAVSEAACSPACGGPDGDDQYEGASSDGSVVFFTTPRRLLNADTDSGTDLYAYDSSPPSGQPELALASGGSAAAVTAYIDTAADGSRAYFIAKGALAGPNSRGEAPAPGESNLYVYERDETHPSGRLAFIATVVPNDVLDEERSTSYALPRNAGSGDGHLLLFLAKASLLAEDTDSNRDLYRYDDGNAELDCLSCMGNESLDVSIVVRSGSLGNAEQMSRSASADGSSAIFTTKEGLVDEDLNGAVDAYVWRDGSLSLVSAGSGEAGVSEATISPDGANAFFLTQTPLVVADDNNARDLYDARIGGGFAEPVVAPPCASADGCQGTQAPPPPSTETAGSDSFSGPGNRVPAKVKPCRKGTVRKKGRCVKAGKQKGKQKKSRAHRAGTDRGGSR